MNLGHRGSESSSFSSIYNTFFGSSGSRDELSDWDKKLDLFGGGCFKGLDLMLCVC